MAEKHTQEPEGKNCFRCGKELRPGSLSYVTQIRIFAGFDGILLEPEEGVDRQLGELIKQAGDSDPETLEKEVYQEFNFVLCKSCRDRLAGEFEYPWEGPFWISGGTN